MSRRRSQSSGQSPVGPGTHDDRRRTGSAGVHTDQPRGSAGVPPAVSGASRPRYGELTIRDRGRLPHWEAEGSTYFITFRLADSLPRAALEKIKAERQRLVAQREWQPAGQDARRTAGKDAGATGHQRLPHTKERRLNALFSRRVDQYLDRGAGRCDLADRRVADMLQTALHRFVGERYLLFAWCIMPNHVHLLLKPLPGWDLASIMHSIKSYSAKQANRILGRSGVFWQREYYDHIVRDADQSHRFLQYILDNPVKAGASHQGWAGSSRSGV